MPQMAPMNWMILFTLFSLIMMIMCLVNYYSTIYKTKITKNKINLEKKNWKW
uniref:ATP synthase complex subunit 8 n=1 Tax=Anthaxia sp. ANT01 TaxID=1205539 RepID=A0A0S2MRP6_9COLE|nr:ATP synthase F0 subunit 8 [Anthaxia sp. ANT01]